MQAGRSAFVMAVAALSLAASLAGLWAVIQRNSEIRLTGETLSNFVRQHQPKPWHGFETSILGVSVDGEVHIKAHVAGPLIHTPIEITGKPAYDAGAREVFFHVSKVELPRDRARPMLAGLDTMLTPLGSYIAKNLTGVIPVKRIKAETRGGLLFLATVQSVAVDGDAVVVELRGYRIATAAIALMLSALLAAAALIAAWLRRRTPPPPREETAAAPEE